MGLMKRSNLKIRVGIHKNAGWQNKIWVNSCIFA